MGVTMVCERFGSLGADGAAALGRVGGCIGKLTD